MESLMEYKLLQVEAEFIQTEYLQKEVQATIFFFFYRSEYIKAESKKKKVVNAFHKSREYVISQSCNAMKDT